MTFILEDTPEFEPFHVEFVAQNHKEKKELIARFDIKHYADWPEEKLDEFNRIRTQFQKAESLQKKQEKAGQKMTEQLAGQWLRCTRAMTTLIKENGIPDEGGKDVWATLSVTHKSKIMEAWMKDCQEKSKEVEE